jgi:hypothetical protein
VDADRPARVRVLGRERCQPLHAIDNLFGLDGALGLVGTISGIDSSAVTLASANPATGALLWSTSVIRDNYGATVRVDGRGDLLLSLVGNWVGA